MSQTTTDGLRGQAPAIASMAILGVGAATVWAAAWLWGYVVVVEPRERGDKYDDVVFFADHEPVIVTRSRSDYEEVAYRSLDGAQLDSKPSRSLNGAYLYGPAGERGWLAGALPWRERVAGTSSDWWSDPGDTTTWYVVRPTADPSGAYFQGFNARTKQTVGFIGRSGLRQSVPPPNQWFDIGNGYYTTSSIAATSHLQSGVYVHPNNYYSYGGGGYIAPWSVYVIDGDHVVSVDLRTKQTSIVLELPGIASLSTVSSFQHFPVDPPAQVAPVIPVEEGNYVYQLVARSADKIAVFNPMVEGALEFTIPEDLRREPRLRFAWLGGDKSIVEVTPGGFYGERTVELRWIDTNGATLRSEEVELAGSRQVELPGGAWRLALIVPSPGFVAPLAAVFPHLPTSLLGSARGAEAYQLLLRSVAAPLTVVMLLGLASAAVAFTWHRAAGRPLAWLWCLVVFLIGPAGLLAYRWHWGRPVTQQCEACHRTVPRRGEACPACQAEWPTPALTGIEVFA